MRSYACSCCGLLLEYPDEQAVVTCPACGSVGRLPDERVRDRADFRNAVEMQRRGDFINAEASYLRVLDEIPDDADALWGRLLCHYGAQLVTDQGGQRRYTIRMPRSRPLRAQGDFDRACESAPAAIRGQYEQDAAYIDAAMEAIRAKTASMPPYEIFICHKTTMLEGEGLTKDYERARDLYDLLKSRGYRAFFAPADMAGVAAGEDYEAGIYHALHTAKVMLVVCSDPKHLSATWVRSEWERFLSRRDEGENVALIPLLYGGMRESQLPRAFSIRRLQAITMELNGKDTLLARLQDLLPKKQPIAPAKPRKALWPWLAAIVLALALGTGVWYALRGDAGEVEKQLNEVLATATPPAAASTATPTAAAGTATPTAVPSATPTSAASTDTPAPVPLDAISVSVESIIFRSVEDSVEIDLTASGAWRVTNHSSWINLGTVSGPGGTYRVKVQAMANTTGSDRSYTVTFTCGTASHEVTVSQPAAVPTPTVRPTPVRSASCVTRAHIANEYVIDIYDDNTCVITDYLGSETHLTIPAAIEGYQLVRIGKNAFASSPTLVSVTIPAGVTEIGSNAFDMCAALETVTLPDGIFSIGERAFNSCRRLTSINIPSGLADIGQDAFFYCWKLKELRLPKSVTSIGAQAFAWCDNLTLYVYPDSCAEAYAIANDVPCSYIN